MRLRGPCHVRETTLLAPGQQASTSESQQLSASPQIADMVTPAGSEDDGMLQPCGSMAADHVAVCSGAASARASPPNDAAMRVQPLASATTPASIAGSLPSSADVGELQAALTSSMASSDPAALKAVIQAAVKALGSRALPDVHLPEVVILP